MKTHSIINRSYIALRELIDDVNDHLLALGKLDEPGYYCIGNPLEKIRRDNARRMERAGINFSARTFRDFRDFLEDRAMCLEMLINSRSINALTGVSGGACS